MDCATLCHKVYKKLGMICKIMISFNTAIYLSTYDIGTLYLAWKGMEGDQGIWWQSLRFKSKGRLQYLKCLVET
jgi:hypothetical protein